MATHHPPSDNTHLWQRPRNMVDGNQWTVISHQMTAHYFTDRITLMKKIALILTVLIASACSNTPHFHNSQYWQHKNVSESIYMTGPKAQQMLNRDIARCVSEIRELENMGVLKDAIPTDYHGRVLDPDKLALYNQDSPERNGKLFAEHSDFHDFQGCMNNKGWERIKYVPYDTSAAAIQSY